METIHASNVRTLFSNPGKTWSVVNARTLEDGILKEAFTAVGPIPFVDKEDTIELRGNWIQDPTYGKQFKVETAIKEFPATAAGIESYLQNEVPGIGPRKASRIVQHFGARLKEVLDKGGAELINVSGISEAVAERIGSVWKSDLAGRQIAMFLAQHGISPNWADKVTAAFGNRTVEIITQNPYRLCQVEGIGFKTADRMAQSMGWKGGAERAEAAVVYVFQEATQKGHVYLHHGEAINDLVSKISISAEEAEAALESVIAKSRITRDQGKDELGDFSLLYLPRLHQAEEHLAVSIAGMAGKPGIIPDIKLDRSSIQSKMQVELSEKQMAAIASAFENKLSIITGGPGSGKTTVVQAIVKLAEELDINYFLAAPTGRASKRLSEVSERAATTIHRLLKYNPKTNLFEHDSSNPIDTDLIIIDESSMNDLELSYRLFEAIPNKCSVVLIGDTDQLPAVGPGMVLQDIIRSGKIKVTTLDVIFRQAEGSLMINNSYRILRGEMPVFPPKGSEADSYLIPAKKNKAWIDCMLTKLCQENIPKKLNINPIRDIQILIPMKRGDAGTYELNVVLQNALNPSGQVVPAKGKELRINDRVMQLKNDYKLDVFNGDIGFITGWDQETNEIEIDFYGRTVKYPFASTSDLVLAYATTIHKSQGSEYPVVIILLLNQHYVMLERNLLYTANTRARKMVIYLAAQSALKIATKRCDVKQRNTFLTNRINMSVKETS